MNPVLAWVTAASAIVVALVGAWTTSAQGRSARRASPYEALAKRVVDLEKSDEEKAERIRTLDDEVDGLKDADKAKGREIERLQDQIRLLGADKDALIAYVRVMWEWAVSGSPPPPPAIPDELHGVLPPSAMWRQQDPRDLPHVPLKPEQD